MATPVVAFYSTEDDTTLMSLITFPEGEYDIGSGVTVTVHVFDSGDYTSVDEVEVFVGDDAGVGRPAEVTEAGTGRYTATFTIRDTDVGSSSGRVQVSARVKQGDLRLEPTQYVPLPGRPELVVNSRIEGGGWYVDSGDQRTLVWEVRYDGDLVDAETVLNVIDHGDYRRANLTRVSTGVWRYEYEASPSNSSSHVVAMFEATYDAPGEGAVEESEYTYLYFNPMLVWAKRIGTPDTEGATFDLHISDSDGKPAGAANVSVELDYQTAEGYSQRTAEASADGNGVARLELEYEDIHENETYVEIDGIVEWQGKEQDIGFYLYVRSLPEEPYEPEPSGYGLDVLPEEYVYDLGKDVTYEGTAYYEAEPLASQWVHTYLVTDHQVMAHTNATTGPDGTLSVDFTTPSTAMDDYIYGSAIFKTGTPEGSYYPYADTYHNLAIGTLDIEEEDRTFMESMEHFRTADLRIETDEVEKGTPVEVRFEHPDATRLWTGTLVMGNGPDRVNVGKIPEWTFWCPTSNSDTSPSNGGGFYYQSCEWVDGRFHAAIIIPESMPDDGYFLWAFTYDPNTWDFSGEFHKTNYATLKVGEEAVSGGDDDGEWDLLGLSWVMWLAIIIVLAIVIGAAIAAMRRRTPKETPQVELTATEGPPPGAPPAAPAPGVQYQQPPPHALPPEQVYQPPPQEPAHQPPPQEPAYEPPPQEPAYQPPPQEPAYEPSPQEPVAPPVEPPSQAPPPARQETTPAPATATMTIRCQKCNTTMQIPTTRPIHVTCPNCGASGVLN